MIDHRSGEFAEPTAVPSSPCPPVSKRRQRARGEIEVLPSGSLRVRVYAGIDAVTGKKNHLVETIPAGPSTAREVERVRTRLRNEVDERRNPRTRATLDRILDRWLEVAGPETTTHRKYVVKLSSRWIRCGRSLRRDRHGRS